MTPRLPTPVTGGHDGAGDRFALAHHVLALRETLTPHLDTIGEEARAALTAEVQRSARDAEDAIIQMMPWLSDDERGEAIELLVKLRASLPLTARD